ncbi:hypothetical protein CBR_g30885 [Chara braunii]|uniref:Retrotransposon gag domain-containing protein n=1 Tax=Chara braunii TaxID=69332 RepID=A0A388LDN2_CHABU|nr:hypothetical protein CBR_g30885 [Chara braunii]|eukprot:GBG80420.1 hypothetical protein CBR_g30885 [Chara braunii]
MALQAELSCESGWRKRTGLEWCHLTGRWWRVAKRTGHRRSDSAWGFVRRNDALREVRGWGFVRRNDTLREVYLRNSERAGASLCKPIASTTHGGHRHVQGVGHRDSLVIQVVLDAIPKFQAARQQAARLRQPATETYPSLGGCFRQFDSPTHRRSCVGCGAAAAPGLLAEHLVAARTYADVLVFVAALVAVGSRAAVAIARAFVGKAVVGVSASVGVAVGSTVPFGLAKECEAAVHILGVAWLVAVADGGVPGPATALGTTAVFGLGVESIAVGVGVGVVADAVVLARAVVVVFGGQGSVGAAVAPLACRGFVGGRYRQSCVVVGLQRTVGILVPFRSPVAHPGCVGVGVVPLVMAGAGGIAIPPQGSGIGLSAAGLVAGPSGPRGPGGDLGRADNHKGLHEDATRALNSRVQVLEQSAPRPDVGESSSTHSTRQLEERVDHVVAMLGDISTFAAPATISKQLDTLKTEVQQLHQLPNKDGNTTQHYKMPTFQIKKFDDYTHQDPVLWWEGFTMQLRILFVPPHSYIGALFLNSKGGCQIWLSHLATVHGVDVANLEDKISWEELTRLWKKRFIVDDAPTLAINRLFAMRQGNTSTRDWLTEWQRSRRRPISNCHFRICVASSTTGHVPP